MKRCLAKIILILLFFAYSAHAADLKLSESTIDFGNVKEGPPVTKTITITNNGADTVRIANTSTSCACTSVNLSKQVLEPGESAELLITYQTYKYPGKFDKTITIFTGPEGKEETVIHILGNVDPVPMGVIGLNPRKTEVGELKVNNDNRIQIVIENEGDAPLKISKVHSSKFNTEYFNAGETGEIEIPAKKKIIMGFVITPDKSGRFLDTILIYSDARNDIGKGYKGLISGTAK